MKWLIVLVLLVGCGRPVTTTEAEKATLTTSLLVDAGGFKVYRFYDRGKAYYVVVGAGSSSPVAITGDP